MRQQNSIAFAVRQIIKTAQLVCHGMHMTKARIVKGHTGQVLGKTHTFTGLNVSPVGHCRSEEFGNKFNGLFRC